MTLQNKTLSDIFFSKLLNYKEISKKMRGAFLPHYVKFHKSLKERQEIDMKDNRHNLLILKDNRLSPLTFNLEGWR